jgi:hypothetical protein
MAHGCCSAGVGLLHRSRVTDCDARLLSRANGSRRCVRDSISAIDASSRWTASDTFARPSSDSS